jgi:hypothetical protein
MTHMQALIHDIVRVGFATYARLLRRYPDHNYAGFTAAAYHARKNGLIVQHGKVIEAAPGARCPLCGRALGKG